MNRNNHTTPSGAEFTINNVLRATFFIFSADSRKYLLLALIASCMSFLVQRAFVGDLPIPDDLSSMTEEQSAQMQLFVGHVLMAMAASAVLQVIPVAMMIFGAMQCFRGYRFTIRESFVAVQPRIPALIGVAVISILLVFVGLSIMVVPGILAILFFMPVEAICLIERLGVVASLRRSASLMADVIVCFRTLLIIVVLWAPTFMATILVNRVFSGSFEIVSGCVVLIDTLWTALFSVTMAVVYFYVVFLKENKNSDTIARQFHWDDSANDTRVDDGDLT